MAFKQMGLRSGRTRNWFFVGLAGLVLVIILAMIIGIVTNNRSESYAVNSPGYYTSEGGATATAAPAATTAAAATAAASAARFADNAAPGASNPAQQGQSSSQPLPADRLIIRNATVSLTSNDVDKTLLDVRTLAAEKSGVVFQSNSSVRNDKTYASITIQVPSSAFDETLNRLRKLNGVKVENESASSQDVTEEYVDIKAQLNNLKATEIELLKLLSKATTVSDILTVQREVNNVRSQIDRLQGRATYLEKKTDLSSITISLAPSGVASTVKEGWDIGQVFETAWAGSLRGLQGLVKLLVTVGVWAIWLGPLLALFVFLVVFAFRRLRTTRPQLPPTAPPPPAEGMTA